MELNVTRTVLQLSMLVLCFSACGVRAQTGAPPVYEAAQPVLKAAPSLQAAQTQSGKNFNVAPTLPNNNPTEAAVQRDSVAARPDVRSQGEGQRSAAPSSGAAAVAPAQSAVVAPAQSAVIAPPQSVAAAPAHARVAAVRMWPALEYTRVAIETSSQVRHTFFSLRNPDRLVLDLESIESSIALAELPAKVSADDPHIRAVRVARNRPGVMRIVFDLKVSVEANVFPVRPVGGYGHRLVMDIVPTQPLDPLMALLNDSNALRTQDGDTYAGAAPSVPTPSSNDQPRSAANGAAPAATSGGQTTSSDAVPAAPAAATARLEPAAKPSLHAAAPATAAATAHAGTAASPSEPANSAKEQVDRLLIVAVDAGHGGEDPGAHGRGGTREKDVTLAIARRIKAELAGDPNIRVVLTRDGDYFVPLATRVAKARRARADVFVSIHADAFVRPDARGSSVFALSPRGASSAAARWLARQENQADLIGGVNLSKRDPNLARTLLDLSQTATINDSLRLGRLVLREIGGVNRLHKPRVEQAGFAVLKAPDIPSILVETAFISNPAEERRLADAEYQIRLARVIVDGIKKYLAAHVPVVPRAKVALN